MTYCIDRVLLERNYEGMGYDGKEPWSGLHL